MSAPSGPELAAALRAETCRLCAAPVRHAFDKTVLGRHRVGYHACSGCGSLQTEPPHWLDEAYSGAAERFDTGKASRTLINVHTLPSLLDTLGVKTSDVAVDFGGGTGLFARLMRDRGYNFHTHDTFGSSEFMGGYVWEALDRPAKLVTLFDVAEHFADPAAEWARIFAVDPDWVIGSTGIYTAQGADWHHLNAESGRRVFFYTLQALAQLAWRSGRSAYHLGSCFLITRQPLEAAAQARISAWRVELPAVCRANFETWMQGPYTHAGADHDDILALARLRQSGRRIAVDGVFFRYATGVSRVWRTLFACWSASDFAQSVVVIDRVRTAPRLPGFTYVDVPDTDFARPELDGAMLQEVCDANGVALFISTYYSAPTRTPTAMLVYDMIPEVFGHDMSGPQWVAKTQSLAQAQMYLSISHSTERDLLRFVPKAQAQPRAVTHCGCDFRTASVPQVDAFKASFGIQRPYFLVCGTRAGPKNVELFFQAFALLGAARSNYAIVCTNANQQIEPELAAHLGEAALHLVVLSNAELQCAYSGAIALAYPSRYEGFGLPVLEAMACSCPVITCANSSLTEVGGDAVRYVDPDSVTQMQQAIVDVQQPAVRADLIRRGLQQAAGFSWTRMARDVGRHLASWAVSVP